MYYLLSYLMMNEKTDINLSGTIYDTDKKVVGRIFNKGRKFDIQKEKFTIIVDKKDSLVKNRMPQDKIPTYVLRPGRLFLVSSRVVELFKTWEISNVQMIDVSIKMDTDSNFLKGYKIANILDKIDCADIEKSELTFFEDGDIDDIKKLVLDENKIPENVKIFLLGRRATGIIIVNKELKEKIEMANLTGFDFYNLEDADTLY